MDNRVELDVTNSSVDISSINNMIDSVHEETKRQQAELDALNELDVLLKRLIIVNNDRKDMTKVVKRRMRMLDQNL